MNVADARFMRRRWQRPMVSTALAVAALTATGCHSGSGMITATTCNDYARLDKTKRTYTVADRLRAHEFDDLNHQLHQQVDDNLDEFCGGPFDPLGNDTAKRHSSEPIDVGVRWDRLGP